MAKSKKITKKAFFEVKAPITATKISLYASSPEELEGKIITLDLTRNLRGKNIILKLKVQNENGALTSEPIGLELVGSYIRKMFRSGIDYVEDSFVTECKDAKVLVKPFLITRNKVSRSIRKELRDISRKYLESTLRIKNVKEIFTEIITNKIQKDLSLKLKKTYPLALCEIRILKILPEKKVIK
jgi:ribosomal protein S3AE